MNSHPDLTREENAALAEAISHNCGCEFGIMGMRKSTCAAHGMAETDPAAALRLVFWRRHAQRLVAQEWTVRPFLPPTK